MDSLHTRSQAGQILLIVILVIIIASTIGLSLASRSITSLRTSTEEAESQKALAAAEAGIERAIQGNVPIALPLQTVLDSDRIKNSTYSTEIKQVDSSRFLINGGNLIPKDEGADVWIVSRKDDGITPDYDDAKGVNFINLYWGSASEEECGPAAIEVVVVTRNPDPVVPDTSPDKIKSYRYAYDGCDGRRAENKFAEADSGPFPGNTFSDFKYRTKPQNDLAKNIDDIVFIRVIPIYKDAVVAVSACNYEESVGSCTELPSQGYVITSTGTSGDASRKLTVFKGYPQTYLPYLSYGLFVAN